MQQLDSSKRLLADEKGELAFALLGMIAADLDGKSADSSVWYRLWQHRATALFLLGRPDEALEMAKRALDINPDGPHAILNAGQAAMQTGDLKAAAVYIDRLLALDPTNVDAWSVRLHIHALAGTPATEPPAEIANSPGYRRELARTAAEDADWQTVVAITRPLLATGDRDPQIRFLLASALTAIAFEEASGHEREEAERLATELLDDLPEDHRFTARLYAMRAELRRLRKDTEGCESDLKRAEAVRDRDPQALIQLAHAQLHAGRADYVLQTLAGRVAEEHPMLLAIRAKAYAHLDRKTEALNDIERAVARADEAHAPDLLRLYAADVAVAMGSADVAARILDSVQEDAAMPDMLAALRGRVAFLRKDAVAMERVYRSGVVTDPRLKRPLLSELAQRLVRLGAAREAVAVFEEIGYEALPVEVHGDFVTALFASNDLVRAAAYVDAAVEKDNAPDWALHIGSQIADRRGDIKKSIQYLQRLSERYPEDLVLAFNIVERLLRSRDPASAMPYLDRLAARAGEVSPMHRMGIAQLLKQADRGEEAQRLAFTAYRAAPQDAEIQPLAAS